MMDRELLSINPATGDEVGRVPVTPVADIPAVVARARRAQVGWGALSATERAEVLRGAVPLLMGAHERLGALGTAEMGKPAAEMLSEAKHVAETLNDDLLAMVTALSPEVTEGERAVTTVYRDALGVAACIAPWNFPVLMPYTQVIPALMAGNAVVFKPSERTPLTGAGFAEALQSVLPTDVLQVVHGDGEQGRALVGAGVDLIAFTGSHAAGQHILGQASQSLTRVVLELGGKDPLIVLSDADIPRAARFAARNSFQNAGQVCVSTERIYVDDAVHDAFVQALIAESKTLQLGPMVDARQKFHVVAQVDEAISEGARVAWRSDRIDGNYLGPIVLTGVDHTMRIATEETFGPVACVFRVQSEDEAVERANDTPYGLGAVVFGGERASHVARQMTAGMVGVNQGIGSVTPTPWVGARQSGYGFHSGTEGHRQFAQVRVITESR